MEQTLDYNEVFTFMKEFQADFINRYNELIIDQPTNTYASLNECKSIEDVKAKVVFALCRPIGKGLQPAPAKRLLKRVNEYFKVELTKEDMHLMYQKICYSSKFDEFKDFVQRGFPMQELATEEE